MSKREAVLASFLLLFKWGVAIVYLEIELLKHLWGKCWFPPSLDLASNGAFV